MRSGDFQEYINVLTVLSAWVLFLNHCNYARCFPIRVRTMLNSKEDVQSVSIERKVYSAEDQPKILKNRAGLQSRTTKWQNQRCWCGNWMNRK